MDDLNKQLLAAYIMDEDMNKIFVQKVIEEQIGWETYQKVNKIKSLLNKINQTLKE